MQKITLFKRAAMAITAILMTVTVAEAQEIGETQGYINMYVTAKVVPEGCGKVWLSANRPGQGLPVWKTTESTLQRVMPISHQYVAFYANAQTVGDYIFCGWYLDDGDGEFDITKDELVSTETESLLAFNILELTGSDEYYETEAEANAAAKPTEPQAVLFALFTNGATAQPERNMEKFGQVVIDNPYNNIGDQVTITAIPEEGYQFEYWKTKKGTTILDSDKGIVSRQNPYTFTVQGGEKLYAYFSDIDAPTFEFPSEGGWKVLDFNNTTGVWVLHELSNAICYLFDLSDLVYENGQLSLRSDDELSWYDSTQAYNTSFTNRNATIVYGAGTVRFAWSLSKYYGGANVIYGRLNNEMVQYTGSKPVTINDPDGAACYHFYRFDEELQGFYQFATTDFIAEPDAPESVTIPAQTAYIKISAYDLTDPSLGLDFGYEIPTVIALSPKAFEPFVEVATDIEKAAMNITESEVGGMKIYTLSGMKVTATDQPGIYIMNGRKVVVK